MKQLLFLLLFPCLALAQYTGNGNQKITLGEQTTADGLVFRGVASDTTLTVKSDTAAYFVLDTVNLNLFTYKASASGAKWRQLGADTAVIAYVNTYGTQTVNGAKTFTSAVTATRFNPTENTATGTGMFAPTSNSLGFSTNGIKKMTLDSSGNLGLGITPNQWVGVNAIQLGHLSGLALYGYSGTGAEISSNIFFNGSNYVYTTTNRASRYALSQGQHRWFIAPPGIQDATISDNQVMTIYNDGNIGINVNIPTEKLHVVGNARITAMNGIGDIGADANGVLQAATSDINLKNTIENSPFGLNEILLLNPVTFLYNDENRKIDSDVKEVGFIAQDVFDVIPNAVSSTGTGDLQLDYRAITATLTKAIQEQQALIKALEQRLLILENK